ncbi:NAD(P)-binding protein, partial [Myriangium duriaei CBS 260.36]
GSSGIGLSLATMLIADESKHVIITSRSSEKGQAVLHRLKALKQPGIIEMFQLELSNPHSITNLGERLRRDYGRIDALVNNAAQAIAPPGTSLFDHMQRCFAVNVCGPAFVIETFLPLLEKSIMVPRIINVGSGGGSISRTLDPSISGGPLAIPYKTSKAALNMLSSIEVAIFRETEKNVKVFTYCPGFCVSNLGPYNKPENGAKPTEQGACPMITILNGEKDAEHGCFLNSEGTQHPW